MADRIQVGDFVKKPSGSRTALVLEELYGDGLHIQWQHNGTKSRVYRRDFVKADAMTNSTTLFEVNHNGTTKIATKLMEKSNKAWIMEIKGTCEVLVVDPKDVSEIVPYTIEVNLNGNSQHFQVDEGAYNVDEVYLMGKTLQLARIVKLDTRNKATKNTFKPFAKLMVQV